MCKMSKLKSNLNFVRLLLQTSKVQAIALLETVSKSQTDCIGEILLNLSLGNIIKPNEKEEKLLHKSRRILNLIKNRKLSNSKRGSVIRAHPNIVLDLLALTKEYFAKVR